MFKLRPFLASACCAVVLILFSIAPIHAQAQAPPAQSRSATEPAIAEAIENYAAGHVLQTGVNSSLLIGRIQAQMPDNTESLYLRERGSGAGNSREIPTPVDQISSYATGDLLYDGVLYRGVRMRLDLVRDELVAAAAGNTFVGAVLNPERLSWADLRGYRVVHLGDGYYMQLWGGENAVLKKESYQYSVSQMQFTSRVVRYFLYHNGEITRIRATKGSILGQLRDRRAELDAFIRREGINFRRYPEEALVQVVSEYERLTQSSPAL